MAGRRSSLIACSILFLVAFAMLAGAGTSLNFKFGKTYSSLLASGNYSENLAVYTTSNEAFWSARLNGGNISLGSSFALPSGVSGFSLILTHYNSWNPTFETFTKYGLGLLGPNEPMPNASLLTVYTTTPSAASTLAATLSQMFALVFTPYSSTATSVTFISPMDFVTEMHVYFWKLIPASAGGFASIMPESSYEALDLNTYNLTDSSGVFSIVYGGLTPVTSTSFALYDLFGVTSLNYSSSSTSSAVQVHVLGGVSTGVNSSFVNTFANFSSFASASYAGGSNKAVPNLNATLNFSFPVIVAYRQMLSLAPTVASTDTATITVHDVSPSGSPPANVTVNDDWIKTLYPSDFNITFPANGDTNGTFTNMTSGTIKTFTYNFKVGNVSGTFPIPATAVPYTFVVANKTLSETTSLNNETLTVGVTNQPELETIAQVGVIQAAQAFSVNVTVVNKGSGLAYSLGSSTGQTLSTLAVNSAWSFNITQTSPSLTSVNASITSIVSWQNLNLNVTFHGSSNGIIAIYGFANPGSPGTSLSKSISLAANHSYANVTLSLFNTGSNAVTNASIADSIPAGLTFSKYIGNNTVHNVGNLIYTNASSLAAGASINYTYVLNITNAFGNYVFLPANVSASWNNATVVHYSQGLGLPLGVVATKLISPSFGFQGSNVTEQLSIDNKGNLSVYFVATSNSSDSFISTVLATGKTVPVLSPGQSTNSTLKGFFTAAPGNYSTSPAAASFIFAGSNQTAATSTYSVVIFNPVSSVLFTSSSRIEENHAIDVTIEISNRANVTVTNINYAIKLPSDLTRQSGELTGTISSLGPNQNTNRTFVIETGLPNSYTISGGNLTFQYGGQTLRGVTNSLSINIVDDVTTRYLIPVGIGLVIVIGTLFYVRRLSKIPPTAPRK